MGIVIDIAIVIVSYVLARAVALFDGTLNNILIPVPKSQVFKAGKNVPFRLAKLKETKQMEQALQEQGYVFDIKIADGLWVAIEQLEQESKRENFAQSETAQTISAEQKEEELPKIEDADEKFRE